MKEENYFKIPDKEREPFIYSIWKRLDLIKATPLERLIMLELRKTFVMADWIFGRQKDSWDRKDMREFVRDLAIKIEELYDQKPTKKTKQTHEERKEK